MSVAVTRARSIAAFEACTARSIGEKSFSLPPKVPNGVRTAERETTLPEVARAVITSLGGLRFLSAVDAELPDRVELRSASFAALNRQILTAVRAVDHWSSLRKSAPTKTTAFGTLHRRERRHREARAFGRSVAAITARGKGSNRISAGVLGRDRHSDLLDGTGNERDARLGVVTKSTEIGMLRTQLLFQPILHRLIGANVPVLSG